MILCLPPVPQNPVPQIPVPQNQELPWPMFQAVFQEEVSEAVFQEEVSETNPSRSL